ncbi:hypothetical protein QE152_g39352 [Popillia japonica]|uniref:Uncharacterized protein n=1 Tax=Popillia japonica TaxID=7064 RepID=A0AAW1HU27_POPJA
MVLTRAHKDEIADLISSTLEKYFSNGEMGKNATSFESIVARYESSLNVITERLDGRISKLEENNLKLHKRLNDCEQYSRRNSLRIFGVEEEDNENVYDKIKKIFNKMEVNVEGHIDRCHCIGKNLSVNDVNKIKRVPTEGKKCKQKMYNCQIYILSETL